MKLSIYIPTYNRTDKLKELYQSFLCRPLEEYSSQIEVVVCDNSDEKNAYLNQTTLEGAVHYYKNATNIDFDGNMISVRQATRGFIWIISDDDLILWDGFKRLMDCLPTAKYDGIDCLMLPINHRTLFGEVIEYKEDASTAKKDTDTDILSFVITLSTVPFRYFAGSVICLDKKRLDWVEKEFQGNIFLQIPLFLRMLKPSSK